MLLLNTQPTFREKRGGGGGWGGGARGQGMAVPPSPTHARPCTLCFLDSHPETKGRMFSGVNPGNKVCMGVRGRACVGKGVVMRG